jgi:hypothetical protein
MLSRCSKRLIGATERFLSTSRLKCALKVSVSLRVAPAYLKRGQMANGNTDSRFLDF